MEPATDAAWVAGVFEGEGSITVCRTRPRLGIQMTDRDVIERIAQYWNPRKAKVQTYVPKNEKHQIVYRIEVHAADEVERILLDMMPWFGERRRARAHQALHSLRTGEPMCLASSVTSPAVVANHQTEPRYMTLAG